MNEYIGNCSNIIDWNSVIEHLEDQEEGILIDCNEQAWRKRISKMSPAQAAHNTANLNRWIENNYDLTNADFFMYRPRLHFTEEVAKTFCKFAGIEFDNVWIARIDPGCIVPRHFDIYGRDEEEKFARIICFISLPEVGHSFTVGDTEYLNIPQGDAFRWNKATQWHSGYNSGSVPSYTLHIEGLLL